MATRLSSWPASVTRPPTRSGAGLAVVVEEEVVVVEEAVVVVEEVVVVVEVSVAVVVEEEVAVVVGRKPFEDAKKINK